MTARALPLHLSAACLLGALATDIAYASTAEMMWSDFSAWLLMAGILLGVVAGIACMIDLFARRFEAGAVTWLYLLCNVAGFIVAVFDAMIHTHDAWTSVVPTGLILSAVMAALIVLAGIFGFVINRQIGGIRP